MCVIKTWHVPLVLILCVAVGVTARTYRSSNSSESAPVTGTQDVTNLDRRISLLEQRFYAIESRINQLEQQAMLSTRTPTPTTSARDSEINLLRSEIEVLQQRLGEIECGLVKLDERTTTPAAREARKRSDASSTDPCRLNADTPLRLSTRP